MSAIREEFTEGRATRSEAIVNGLHLFNLNNVKSIESTIKRSSGIP